MLSSSPHSSPVRAPAARPPPRSPAHSPTALHRVQPALRGPSQLSAQRRLDFSAAASPFGAGGGAEDDTHDSAAMLDSSEHLLQSQRHAAASYRAARPLSPRDARSAGPSAAEVAALLSKAQRGALALSSVPAAITRLAAALADPDVEGAAALTLCTIAAQHGHHLSASARTSLLLALLDLTRRQPPQLRGRHAAPGPRRRDPSPQHPLPGAVMPAELHTALSEDTPSKQHTAHTLRGWAHAAMCRLSLLQRLSPHSPPRTGSPAGAEPVACASTPSTTTLHSRAGDVGSPASVTAASAARTRHVCDALLATDATPHLLLAETSSDGDEASLPAPSEASSRLEVLAASRASPAKDLRRFVAVLEPDAEVGCGDKERAQWALAAVAAGHLAGADAVLRSAFESHGAAAVIIEALDHADSAVAHAAALALFSALTPTRPIESPAASSARTSMLASLAAKLASVAPALQHASSCPAFAATTLRLWARAALRGVAQDAFTVEQSTMDCLRGCLGVRTPVAVHSTASAALGFAVAATPPAQARAPPALATSPAQEAAAVLAQLATADANLLCAVRYDCLPPLRELLEGGGCGAAAGAAAALAALCRHPSTHERMLRSGTVDILLRHAGSRDPAYRDAQPHIALALERLACNPATQYELVDCGVAAAVCRGLQGASPHVAASLSRAVLALAQEGNSQGDILVHAGVVAELVAAVQQSPGRTEALEALHGLFLHAGAGACTAALDAGAPQLLVGVLQHPQQRVRQRAARMLALLLHTAPAAAGAALTAGVVAPLCTMLCTGGLSEQVEALDALYLLRTEPAVQAGLATQPCVAALAQLLELAAQAGPEGNAEAAGVARAAEHGFFQSPHQLGSALHHATIAGKVVRLLVYLARGADTWRPVAECAPLAAPLARVLAQSPIRTCAAQPPPPLLRVHESQPPPRAAAVRAPAHWAGGSNNSSNSLPEVPRNAGAPAPPSILELLKEMKRERTQEEVPAPVVDVPEELLKKLEQRLCGTAAVLPALLKEPELRMYSTTTAQAAQLLLTWMRDSACLPAEAVLDPLVMQLWLGSNVALLDDSDADT